MYTIAGLMVMALYQRRHSDTQANPHLVYIFFAFLIFLVVRLGLACSLLKTKAARQFSFFAAFTLLFFFPVSPHNRSLACIGKAPSITW